MAYQLDYEVSDKKINWLTTALGVAYLGYRFYVTQCFVEPDGRYHPDAFHISYFVAILFGLALVCSFRVKPLNIVIVGIMPSVLVSFTLVDVPLIIDPVQFGYFFGHLRWWNHLLLHWPVFVAGLYIMLTCHERLSKESIWIMTFVIMGWFLLLDNKDNGIIDGSTYTLIAIPLILSWSWLVYFLFLRKVKGKDPLIAPTIKIRRFRLVKTD